MEKGSGCKTVARGEHDGHCRGGAGVARDGSRGCTGGAAGTVLENPAVCGGGGNVGPADG
jgi:hypothetical protein